MVGSVGMGRSVLRPNSAVIQEALNLLSALGSSEGNTTKLLIEMKIVQDHNETVLANAKEEIVKANERVAEVVEKEAELARNLIEAGELYNSRLLDITNGETELQRKVDEVNVWISEEDEKVSEREDKLRRDREEHQESTRISTEEFVERERILSEDRDELKALGTSVEGRQEEINSDKITLDDLRDSLGELKARLDQRDARMRAAMEGEAVVEGG